ncbi:transcriptional regulator [Pseudoalteromonas sp. UBA2102]|uniref:transcriptional regulator n=1 Tax=Pseudoalteromonas sp. UBA2102 TaxID=1947291 RepID=UPI00257F56C8|nr:transcriptional regulator [Pseudoalteromonas sp. UBA2102]|tara:strand:- start:5789 stop:6415 length:627 start_codon:yes stop_codon:yes gene_type:complete
MDWVIANKDWLFSGVGLAVVGFILTKLFSVTKSNANPPLQPANIDIKIDNTNALPTSNKILKNDIAKVTAEPVINKTLEDFKNETRILFIDDDMRFKVSKILIRSGWVHTKLIKDCETLDEQDVIKASILFIDVQGVGLAMGFNDEGLGLALAIKQKYPKKKVVIYSAETQGDRFHKALREADSFLAKNADPYEFQRLVEEFTIGGHS